MMKKLAYIILCCLLLTGCSKSDKDGIDQEDTIHSSQKSKVDTENDVSSFGIGKLGVGDKSENNKIPSDSEKMSSTDLEQVQLPTNMDYTHTLQIVFSVPMARTEEVHKYNSQESKLKSGEMITVANGEALYLDNIYTDTGTERKKVELKEIVTGAQDGYKRFNFCVGECCDSQVYIDLTGSIYAATFRTDHVFFLLPEDNGGGLKGIQLYYFEQDDEGEHLVYMGRIEGSILGVKDNTLLVHGADQILYPHVFDRDFTYVMCQGTLNNCDYFKLVKLPEGCAPVGNIFELKHDLILYDRYSETPRCRITKDSYAAISATDGEEWIYMEELLSSLGGWFKISTQDGKKVINNGNETVEDYFDGLIMGY